MFTNCEGVGHVQGKEFACIRTFLTSHHLNGTKIRRRHDHTTLCLQPHPETLHSIILPEEQSDI